MRWTALLLLLLAGCFDAHGLVRDDPPVAVPAPRQTPRRPPVNAERVTEKNAQAIAEELAAELDEAQEAPERLGVDFK